MAGGGRGEWCTGSAPFRWSYRSTDTVSDKLCVILICELSVYRPNIQLCRVLVNSQNEHFACFLASFTIWCGQIMFTSVPAQTNHV